jgi:hypothetical protein
MQSTRFSLLIGQRATAQPVPPVTIAHEDAAVGIVSGSDGRKSGKASKELAMSPLAKLRVSTLACALFFSISTAAQPAL